jgi:hypothetical protein
MVKRTAERRKKLQRTMDGKRKARAKTDGGQHDDATRSTLGFPAELDRALEEHYRKRIIGKLLSAKVEI